MSKKSIIIVAICFAIVIIALIVGYVLYLTTDLFKSNSEIFQKHFVQNINVINSITDFSKEQDYINTLTQKNYKDNTNIKVSYKNSQERVEEFNIASDGITNNESNNTYKKIDVKYGEDYNIINAEYLRENQMYGLLFPTIVKQFASIDANYLDLVLSKVNINKSEIEKYNITELWNLIQNNKENVEKICIEFAQEINEAQYSKQKESAITLSNEEQVTTTNYILKLSSEQTRKLLFNILRELNKQEVIDEFNQKKVEFSETYINIYVINDKTARMTFEAMSRQLRIDFYDNELNVKYTDLSSEEMKTIDIDIKNEDGKKYIQYEDLYNNKVKVELGVSQEENTDVANVQVSIQNDYIPQLDISLNQKMQISDNTIEVAKKFESEPNVILSKLNVTGINTALDSLLQIIDTKIRAVNNDINSEIINIWLQQNKKLETGYQGQKEKEKNNFNNQFKAYKGTEVDKKLLYNMLDVVSRNILKYEKVSEDKIIIYIKQGKANKEMTQEIKEIIDKDNEKFDINFQYDSEGRINAIIMEKSKKEN